MPKYFPVFEDIQKHKKINNKNQNAVFVLQISMIPQITTKWSDACFHLRGLKPADQSYRCTLKHEPHLQIRRSFINTRAADVYKSLNACFKRTDSWKPIKPLQTAATVKIRNSIKISPAVAEGAQNESPGTETLHISLIFKTLTRAIDAPVSRMITSGIQLKMKQSVQVWGLLQYHLSQVRMCCDAGDNVCVCNTQRYHSIMSD